MKPIRVFIAEDHPLTRQGLRYSLKEEAGFEIVGEEADGSSVIEQVLQIKPDVVLMDIILIGLDGIQATRSIKEQSPETKIIMLTSHDSDEYIFSAFAAGADGYCLKNIAGDKLRQSIRSVADGVGWLDPAIAKKVLQTSVQHTPATAAPKTPSKYHLSARELEVLTLVVEGLSNQEIGSKLFLSPETIKSHMRKVFEKLLVADRTQAAVKALREGII